MALRDRFTMIEEFYRHHDAPSIDLAEFWRDLEATKRVDGVLAGAFVSALIDNRARQDMTIEFDSFPDSGGREKFIWNRKVHLFGEAKRRGYIE